MSSIQQSNLKSGTVYKKISDFLANNPSLDAEPVSIQSKNTATNAYTKKKKRHYVDMIGDALCPSLSRTITGRCYDKLRKLENDLDVSIAKRHNCISSQLQQQNNGMHNNNVTRILRLELFNTFHPDPQDTNKNKWSFKLQTKLFHPNDMKHPINYENNRMEYMYHHPLQSIISRINIKLDSNALNVDGNKKKSESLSEIEWNNPNWRYHDEKKEFVANVSDLMDGIEIERNGNKNCKMDIYLYLSNWFIPFEQTANTKSVVHNGRNALCKMSKALQSILGLGYLSDSNRSKHSDIRYHTKSEILQSLGHYIRENNLIRNDNSMAIDCNEALERIIGQKTVYSANVWKILMVKKHILRPDPIHIEHEICVSGDIKENAKIYDVLVKVPSLIALKASKLMEPTHDLYNVESDSDQYALTINSLNVQISNVLEQINAEKKEQILYDQYSKDPVSTIDVLVSNQRENLQIIREFCENAAVKPSQYYADSSVYTDIKRYLKKRQMENQQNQNN